MQAPYLAAAGEAPVRAHLGAQTLARERQARTDQADTQRLVVAQFVRRNPGRTVGVVAVLGLLTGMLLLRR
ncbi:MAG TPA: hypothetical protein VH105_01260 [Burkholderiales bacterium]|jgi:ElaB/YqjD/DUF883 family membrane-anchored ribosome-binding protein|nr:hypothetical protein [Burkholderiales bacterium]